MPYVDMNAYMDNRTINLFDDLLMLEEIMAPLKLLRIRIRIRIRV